MVRSLIVICLAIVCGAAAAVGVNQFIARQAQARASTDIKTTPILVSKRVVARGEVVQADMVEQVNWPEGLVPEGVATKPDDVVGRTALTTIMQREPVFVAKLTGPGGGGASFVSSIIKPGMRAYTIHTKGPSSSVAGFVRPGDRVDVLLTLRGGTNDETGGGSTTTLLQAIEILAIDQILDSNADTLKMFEMWAKGDQFTSVTLQVTPEQASLLFLGQSNGELSLALRNADDTAQVATNPATIRQIRFLQMGADTPTDGEPVAPDADSPPAPLPASPVAGALSPPARRPESYIHTLRGSHAGRVQVALSPDQRTPEAN
jgi:pilus assembly protein CpaB